MNRNDILLPAADASSFDTALAAIKNRSLLYNTDTKRLYMKYDDVANLVNAQNAADNVNIVLNDSDEVALADDISVKTVTVTPLTGYPSMNDCIDFGVTTASSTIKLLCKKSDINMGAIGGELYESGTGLNSMYHFSLASNGSRFLGGSSSYDTKAYFVDCVYDGNEYYGIKFPSGINAQLLFHGYDNISTLLAPPPSYQDTDFTAITALANETGTGGGSITDELGNTVITTSDTDPQVLISLPEGGYVYHLDSNILDNLNQNSKAINANGTFETELTPLGSKHFDGGIEIPRSSTINDICFLTDSSSIQLKGNKLKYDGTTGDNADSEDIGRLYNEKIEQSISTDWGLTEEQLNSDIFKTKLAQ